MQWEEEIYEAFCRDLPFNPIEDSVVDSMVWNFDNSGLFSLLSLLLCRFTRCYMATCKYPQSSTRFRLERFLRELRFWFGLFCREN